MPKHNHNSKIRISKKRKRDEDIFSDDDDENGKLKAVSDGEDSAAEDEDETPAQKRLRLAKLYLHSVKESLADGEFDAAEIDRELITARLRQDVIAHSGKVHLFIADKFDFKSSPTKSVRVKGHRLSVTSAVASQDGKWLFTSGKEGNIIKHDLSSGKSLSSFFKLPVPKLQKSKQKSKSKRNQTQTTSFNPDSTERKGHSDEVLALALSGDGKLLASGGKDRTLVVWDVERNEWMKTFNGHKDTISSLAFRKNTLQLYTASQDRTLRLYDLSLPAYIETLFGHQDHVLSIDALASETAVSVGGRDKTVRFWKVNEQTQLVFRGGTGGRRVRELIEGGGLGEESGEEGEEEEGAGNKKGNKKGGKKAKKEEKFVEGSLECVAMVDEHTFLTGGDSGSICLWTTQKKKPIYRHALAHGVEETVPLEEGGEKPVRNPRWVTALGCLKYSDVFVSGSWDGSIRVWKLDSKLKAFEQVGSIPALGVVNSLQMISIGAERWAQFGSRSSPADAGAGKQDDGMDEDRESECEDEGLKGKINGKLNANGKGLRVDPVLIVVGLGQEHKFGRWIKVKEGGAKNCALVLGFEPGGGP